MGYDVVDTELIDLTSTRFHRSGDQDRWARSRRGAHKSESCDGHACVPVACNGWVREPHRGDAEHCSRHDLCRDHESRIMWHFATSACLTPMAASDYCQGVRLEEGIERAAGLDEAGTSMQPSSSTDWLRADQTAQLDRLISQIEQLKGIAVPSTFGDFSFTPERHHGATSVQFYRWNADSESLEEVGDPVDISGA